MNSLDSGSWFVSIAFWLVLFACGLGYAAVALSPKLVTYLEIETEYVANQTRLVSLERRNHHLARVAKALESDAHFAGELLRVNLDAAEPGEERITVDPTYHLEVRAESVAATTLPAPWYLPHVRRLATDEKLRRHLLIGIAATIVLAFAFLHDANGPILGRITGGLRHTFGWMGGRYGRSAGKGDSTSTQSHEGR